MYTLFIIIHEFNLIDIIHPQIKSRTNAISLNLRSTNVIIFNIVYIERYTFWSSTKRTSRDESHEKFKTT